MMRLGLSASILALAILLLTSQHCVSAPENSTLHIPNSTFSSSSASSGVMLQGFYWNVPCPGLARSSTWWWDRLAMEAQDFHQAGFTAVWLPPALKSWGYGK